MPGTDKKEARQYLFVKCLYLLFYFSLLVQVSTGLFMAYSDDVDSLKDLRHTAKDIHNVFMWVILSYIMLHIGGVIIAELGKKYKGIVSGMINGKE
jgi:cytochrome b